MGTKLYVGNLNYNTTELALKEAFGADGREVQSVSIIMDRETGRPRGFAFVEMATAEGAQAALAALDGQELEGRMLRINEAREREARGPGAPRPVGGGGGYGGPPRPSSGGYAGSSPRPPGAGGYGGGPPAGGAGGFGSPPPRAGGNFGPPRPPAGSDAARRKKKEAERERERGGDRGKPRRTRNDDDGNW